MKGYYKLIYLPKDYFVFFEDDGGSFMGEIAEAMKRFNDFDFRNYRLFRQKKENWLYWKNEMEIHFDTSRKGEYAFSYYTMKQNKYSEA